MESNKPEETQETETKQESKVVAFFSRNWTHIRDIAIGVAATAGIIALTHLGSAAAEDDDPDPAAVPAPEVPPLLPESSEE